MFERLRAKLTRFDEPPLHADFQPEAMEDVERDDYEDVPDDIGDEESVRQEMS